MKFLNKCLCNLFPDKVKESLDDWQKAELIINQLDVSKVGEWLALATLCEIITSVDFPNHLHTEYIKRAEGLVAEILDINPDHELHMDEIEIINRWINQGINIEEISIHCKQK